MNTNPITGKIDDAETFYRPPIPAETKVNTHANMTFFMEDRVEQILWRMIKRCGL